MLRTNSGLRPLRISNAPMEVRISAQVGARIFNILNFICIKISEAKAKINRWFMGGKNVSILHHILPPIFASPDSRPARCVCLLNICLTCCNIKYFEN